MRQAEWTTLKIASYFIATKSNTRHNLRIANRSTSERPAQESKVRKESFRFVRRIMYVHVDSLTGCTAVPVVQRMMLVQYRFRQAC